MNWHKLISNIDLWLLPINSYFISLSPTYNLRRGAPSILLHHFYYWGSCVISFAKYHYAHIAYIKRPNTYATCRPILTWENITVQLQLFNHTRMKYAIVANLCCVQCKLDLSNHVQCYMFSEKQVLSTMTKTQFKIWQIILDGTWLRQLPWSSLVRVTETFRTKSIQRFSKWLHMKIIVAYRLFVWRTYAYVWAGICLAIFNYGFIHQSKWMYPSLPG